MRRRQMAAPGESAVQAVHAMCERSKYPLVGVSVTSNTAPPPPSLRVMDVNETVSRQKKEYGELVEMRRRGVPSMEMEEKETLRSVIWLSDASRRGAVV